MTDLYTLDQLNPKDGDIVFCWNAAHKGTEFVIKSNWQHWGGCGEKWWTLKNSSAESSDISMINDFLEKFAIFVKKVSDGAVDINISLNNTKVEPKKKEKADIIWYCDGDTRATKNRRRLAQNRYVLLDSCECNHVDKKINVKVEKNGSLSVLKNSTPSTKKYMKCEC